jgi:hypothetical protein
MATRPRGRATAFWNNAATGANGVSNAANLGRAGANVLLFITVSAATTITVEVGHIGDASSEGVLPEGDASTWFPLYYLNDQISIVFAAAGSRAVILPDVATQNMRLRSTNAVTATAGWMSASD